MVPSELGVGALERRVSVSLGLLDTVVVGGSAGAFVRWLVHASVFGRRAGIVIEGG